MTTQCNAGGLFVPGHPKPQGSKTHKGGGRMVESCKDLPAWRERVAYFAAQARPEPIPRPQALAVEFEFVMPRPAYLPKIATPAHAKRPDLSKLVRAAEDALTGILWEDDSQIADLTGTRKRYAEPGEPSGMRLRWSAIDRTPAGERRPA